jgi:hypothetical protein
MPPAVQNMKVPESPPLLRPERKRKPSPLGQAMVARPAVFSPRLVFTRRQVSTSLFSAS